MINDVICCIFVFQYQQNIDKILNYMRFYIILILLGLAVAEVEQVIMINRHGSRAPMYRILDFDDWMKSYDVESLTEVGQRQLYFLGLELRKKYLHLVSEKFTQDEVKVYTTRAERAVQSADSFLYGFYPYFNGFPYAMDSAHQLPPGYVDNVFLQQQLRKLGNHTLPLNYNPIPLETVHSALLNADDFCDQIDYWKRKIMKSEQIENFEQSLWESGFYEEFMEVFSEDLERIGVDRKQE